MFHLTQDQLDLQNRAKELADKVLRDRAAEVDKTEQYPWDNVSAMNDAGFIGMTLPESHGGHLLYVVVGEDEVLEGAGQGGEAVGHERAETAVKQHQVDYLQTHKNVVWQQRYPAASHFEISNLINK